MSTLDRLYRDSLALATDFYELTMAYAHWKAGTAEQEAVFHLAFRRCPFRGQYAVACGLGLVIDFLRRLRFDEGDREYLGGLPGVDGKPLFDAAFLDFLGRARFACDVDALPEGTAVFPHEPLLRVSGPVWQSQFVETALLTLVNFSTLVATKASRVCAAAEGDSVIEFGLRRAQGLDGGVTASRAAFVGGCDGTSNVLAGKLFGIPVRGTHAHSWVMFHEDEATAFRRYAAALPNQRLFLVDTYDTLSGVRHAIAAGRGAGDAGFVGIRLDSGDLAALSIAARRELDAAGLSHAVIVGTSDLDEREIRRLKQAGARIDMWGVGTRLATAHDDPALGGVYKLSAVRGSDGTWLPRMKLSDDPAKSSFPGRLQVRRFRASQPDGRTAFLGDLLYDQDRGPSAPMSSATPHGEFVPPATARGEDLLVPIFRRGELVYSPPSLAEARERTREQLRQLDPSVRRLDDPRPYPVGIDRDLAAARDRLAAKIRSTMNA